MSVAGLWARICLGCALAASLAVVASPPAPEAVLAAEPLALGIGTGLLLFALLARRAPPVSWGVAVTLVLLAGAEEVTWRWFVLGELAGRAGPGVGLVASAVTFGSVHPGARRLHTATGFAFGVVYLVTGSLLAAWAAHATYNVAIATAVRRAATAPG